MFLLSSSSIDIYLFINTGYTSSPCLNAGGEITQKKKSEQPTSSILVMLNINNTKYGGVHYSGNKYGFSMASIDFTVTNEDGTEEEKFSVYISNMLICGEITRQYVSINSIYIGKYIKDIKIYGVKYPSGGGAGFVNTYCENCTRNSIDEDATFNLNMS